ncbi:MAG: phage/plasmid primase, P4 family [Candidatus Woesearchaeota archaeon]
MADLIQIKQIVENKILPHTREWAVSERNRIRNKIRFAKSEDDLMHQVNILNEKTDGFFIDFDKILDSLEADDVQESVQQEFQKIKSMLNAKDTKNSEALYRLSALCMNKFYLFTVQDTDEIFVYESGVYVPYGEIKIAQFIQKGLGGLSSIHVVNETLAHIRRSSYKNRIKIVEPIYKICLNNGILDLNTMEVEPHNFDIIFFNKIPVDFDSESKCNKFEEFLKQILPEDTHNIIQEIFGYVLFKKYNIHKAIMFVGVGANGKSTLLNVLRYFLGNQNISAIPLQQLCINRFSVSSLFGKLANIYADLSSAELKETGIFKALTGEDSIRAERKFKDEFFFDNYAKLIFSCNAVPKTPDDSDAFFRRWIIINFPNQFIGSSANKDLLSKLTTESELSGILNWAIIGLKRLLDNKDFSTAKSVKEVREEYIRMSDSVKAFIMDCIKISPESFEQKRELFTHYTDYCREKSYPPLSEGTFHRDLQRSIRVEDYRPQLEIEGIKQRVQCWKGIKHQKSENGGDVQRL